MPNKEDVFCIGCIYFEGIAGCFYGANKENDFKINYCEDVNINNNCEYHSIIMDSMSDDLKEALFGYRWR